MKATDRKTDRSTNQARAVHHRRDGGDRIPLLAAKGLTPADSADVYDQVFKLRHVRVSRCGREGDALNEAGKAFSWSRRLFRAQRQ